MRPFNSPYREAHLSRVAFPLGGLGAGMICLEGTGALASVSLRHKPDLFHEPLIFSALTLAGDAPAARVLEGPVQAWKLFGRPRAARGAVGAPWGLPRMADAEFEARFPFAFVRLGQPGFPSVELTGWSPFVPGDADASSLPLAALEYRFRNSGPGPLAAVFSFNIWANIKPLGMFSAFADKTIFDLLDYLASNLLMPLGGIVVCILVAWVLPAAVTRAGTGIGSERTFQVWQKLVRYFVPLIIALVFLVNLV